MDIITQQSASIHSFLFSEIYNQNLEFIQKHKLYKLLVSNNYKLINWVNSDLIFSRKDFRI